MIRIVGKRGKGSFESQLDEAAKGKEFVQIDCTSGNKDEVMRGLSPFYLGPVECYDGLKSETFERAWQCAKVYPWMENADGYPSEGYFAWRDMMWAKKGFERKIDIRFPVGKGNARKCEYAWWKVNGTFERLKYIPARKAIYIPLYAKAVVKTEAYRRLVELRDSGKNLMLIDFDGYNIHHPKYNFTYKTEMSEEDYWGNDYFYITRAGSEGTDETLGGTKFDERFGGFEYGSASNGKTSFANLKEGDTITVNADEGSWTY